MKWILLKDRRPDKKIDGKKVLLHRKMNEVQKEMSTSIHDTHMVKHCDENETWWMTLPEIPVY
jgi:hypothetical protein